MPKQAITDQEVENCFEVMSELRPHLKRENFLETIRAMETEGYKLAFIEDQGRVVAVAGYRIYTNLFMGKHLYVDDLVTASSGRSKGYGEAWLTGCVPRQPKQAVIISTWILGHIEIRRTNFTLDRASLLRVITLVSS